MTNINTNNKKRILVIEDDPTRIEWLKDVLEINQIDADVIWHESVNEFIRDCKTLPAPDMIIMDHDLSPGHFKNITYNDESGMFEMNNDFYLKKLDRDDDGNNGMDAVKNILASNEMVEKLKNVPFIIWSANPYGAQLMKDRFIHYGKFTNVSKIPYDMYSLKLLEICILKNLP